MQKRKRYFTIMIVPHSEEATYSFRLPLFVGQLIVALIAAGMVAFFVLAYVYRNALQDAEELRILRQANQAQQDSRRRKARAPAPEAAFPRKGCAFTPPAPTMTGSWSAWRSISLFCRAWFPRRRKPWKC